MLIWLFNVSVDLIYLCQFSVVSLNANWEVIWFLSSRSCWRNAIKVYRLFLFNLERSAGGKVCLVVVMLTWFTMRTFVLLSFLVISYFSFSMDKFLGILGYVVLEGVKNIEKILFNPSIAEFVQFKNRFVCFLEAFSLRFGLLDICWLRILCLILCDNFFEHSLALSSGRLRRGVDQNLVRVAITDQLDFNRIYPSKTIYELIQSPETGLSVVCCRIVGCFQIN